MQFDARAGRWSFLGVFSVALATLMYEVLLTRIFSVTMYYHFAFVAVSVALFGMTLGAVIVYLFPRFFSPLHAQRQMSVSSLLFGLSVVATFIIHLKVHYVPSLKETSLGLWALAGTYSLIAIPFVFSGIAICLALTQFPRQVSRLYAADLAGAAIGCILFVLALRLTDGPTAVLIVAATAIFAAACFARDAKRIFGTVVCILAWIAASSLVLLNGWRITEQRDVRLENLPRTVALAKVGRSPGIAPPVRITHTKGNYVLPPLFEQWNSYSRITVEGDPWEMTEPAGWGMSPKWKDDPQASGKVRQLYINIDAGAGTYMTHFEPQRALELLRSAEDADAAALKCRDRASDARRAGDGATEQRELADQQASLDRATELRSQAARQAAKDALAQAAFLKYDVTNFAHYVRPGSRVLVIGSGGGRDVLSALAFGQKEVIGVEINDAIVKSMSRVFGEFTGHLSLLPQVTIVHDEARSYITRMPQKVDMIQVSLIDTWAATAAGAFVLSENSLYTVEAWETFFSKLSDRGVLTVTRWHQPGRPGETLRVAALANRSLRNLGAADPRKHIVIVKTTMKQQTPDMPDGIANTIVCRAPLTEADLDTIDARAKELGFEVILSPRHSTSSDLAEIAGATDLEQVAAKHPINLAPPTDDQPFFFNMTRLRDAFWPGKWEGQTFDTNLRAVMVLAGLLVFVIVLTVVFIIGPIAIRSQKGAVKNNLGLSAFFACIGLAFILVEIAQMQRLIILLGHPTYSLSVVLFALLVSSGLGSFMTRRVGTEDSDPIRGAIIRRMTMLLLMLAVIGIATPGVIRNFVSASTSARIIAALALLMPAGFFMGMCFPLGMKVAAQRRGDIAAWLWGINGATSVVASVLAVVIAMAWGISIAYWTGTAFYLLALVAIARQTRGGGSEAFEIQQSARAAA